MVWLNNKHISLNRTNIYDIGFVYPSYISISKYIQEHIKYYEYTKKSLAQKYDQEIKKNVK